MGGDDDGQRDAQGAQDQAQGAQPQEGDQKRVQQEPGGSQQADQQVEDYRRALDERDARIRELESQAAAAAESRKAADELRKQIADLRAEAEAERLGYELRLAGCLDVKAASAVLEDHGGKVSQLREDLPWMFGKPAPQGGTTGLEPAGAPGAPAGDEELRRWSHIAGLTD